MPALAENPGTPGWRSWPRPMTRNCGRCGSGRRRRRWRIRRVGTERRCRCRLNSWC